MKTRHCDECQNAKFNIWSNCVRMSCASGHKPRFYQPTSPLDNTYGWKRKCEDFKNKGENNGNTN